MGNSKKRKKKKKVGYNSLGMIAIALVVLVLLGGLMLESNDLKERLTGYDAKAATLQQQIEDEQTRTEEIDKLKKSQIDKKPADLRRIYWFYTTVLQKEQSVVHIKIH
mgnify:CR=1 FL=1